MYVSSLPSSSSIISSSSRREYIPPLIQRAGPSSLYRSVAESGSFFFSNHKLIPPLDPPPRSPQSIHASLLILAQPRLQRLPQDAPAQEINDQPANDAHKRNRVHPVNVFVEDLDANDDTPEIARQQTDVEECRRSEPEHDRSAGIEDEEAERVSGQIAAHFAVVPDRFSVARSIEDARHGPVDEHAPKSQLAHDLVERSLADQEFLRYVTHAVKSSAHQCEEIAFELVASCDAAEAGTLSDVIAAEEDANTADTDEDTDDLSGMVTDMEEDRGDEDDHDDGPKVDKLSRKDSPVGLSALRCGARKEFWGLTYIDKQAQ